eukprot:2595618-Pyramimonas_sp.AAC.1
MVADEEEEDCEDGEACTPKGSSNETAPKRRWRQAASREEALLRQRQKQAAAEVGPLPETAGLPIRVTDGKKLLPHTEMFIHQGNYEKYMHQFDQFHQTVKNTKSFPSAVVERHNKGLMAVWSPSGGEGTLSTRVNPWARHGHTTTVKNRREN